MGLLTIIRKQSRKSKEVRLLILGLDSAGKTTILKRINDEDVGDVSPTRTCVDIRCPALGFNIKTLSHRGCTVNIWDVGGQKSLRAYWRNYFEKTDALVWVVDSTDTLRIADCKAELHGLLQEERLMGAGLLIFANKQDLRGAASTEEISQALDLPSIKSHRWHIQSCSAKTGAGLLNGFDWVMKEVTQRIYCDVGQTPTVDSGPFLGLRAYEESSSSTHR